jgi:methyl-accepting chemotaxis protein
MNTSKDPIRNESVKKSYKPNSTKYIYNDQPIKNGIGIRGYLLFGFIAILSVLVFSILISIVKMTTTENSAKQVINIDLPIYDSYLTLDSQIYNSQSSLKDWLLTHNEKYKDNYNASWIIISNSISVINDNVKYFTHSEKNSWEKSLEILRQIREIQDNIINTNASENLASIQLLDTKLNPLINQALNILDGNISASGKREGGLFDQQYKKLQHGSYEIINNMDSIRNIEYLLLLIGIVLSSGIILITSRKILTPLNSSITIAKKIASGERNLDIEIKSNDEMGELLSALNTMQIAIHDNEEKLKDSEANTRRLFDNITKTANEFSIHSSKVAAGDLTQRLHVNGSKEMDKLGQDLNTMTESLANITVQITDACHNMVTTLEEVKHAINAQSSGASEQASSINEITASLEEIEKSSTQTMEKAKSLGEVAERTREKGQLGLEAVEESVNGMKTVRERVETIAQTILDLSNQTQQVGEITAVVNRLAQQSKMLALNASIEAAKAGEAGKGFAVVALEVKNLAEQSEQSTSQVQKILEDISRATEKAVMATEEGTKGVDHGTALVEQTGDIVRSLSEVIHETTIASQQIEAAIRQEGIGIEQITAGMNEINQVTGSFVESVNQTTEAIENLAKISKSLKEQIDLYKV